jgi:hypothetical protein
MIIFILNLSRIKIIFVRINKIILDFTYMAK